MTSAAGRDRLKAHTRLMGALSEACEAGERVPCIDKPEVWDGELPAMQEAAIHGCGVCDRLAACRRYIAAYPEPEGIWAGLTPKEQTRLHREENQ